MDAYRRIQFWIVLLLLKIAQNDANNTSNSHGSQSRFSSNPESAFETMGTMMIVIIVVSTVVPIICIAVCCCVAFGVMKKRRQGFGGPMGGRMGMGMGMGMGAVQTAYSQPDQQEPEPGVVSTSDPA